MDIPKVVQDLMSKFEKDESLKEKFMKDPVKTIKSLVEDHIPEDKIESIVEAVKAKLGIEKASGLFGKLGKKF